jgi:hypothetical protein
MNLRSINDNSSYSFIEIINSIENNISFSDNINFREKYDSTKFSKSNQELNSNFIHSDMAKEQKIYIKDLIKKLQEAKNERKLAEKNNEILEHRVNLLNNQEKIVII